tara:strand:+ start:370 stop:630 length:261 start_codon:yes stop_codon:yes gene_type:complete
MVKSTSKTRARQRSKSRLKQRNPKGTSSPIPLGKGAFQMGPTLSQKEMDKFMKKELEKRKGQEGRVSETEMDFLRKLMAGKKKFMF